MNLDDLVLLECTLEIDFVNNTWWVTSLHAFHNVCCDLAVLGLVLKKFVMLFVCLFGTSVWIHTWVLMGQWIRGRGVSF